MQRSREVHCIALLLLVLALKLAFPQHVAWASQEPTQEEADYDRKERFAALDKLSEQSPTFSPRNKSKGSAELSRRLLEFNAAIPKLSEATDRYSWELSLDGKLSAPLRDIDTQAGVMLRYLSAAKIPHPELDASEFKGYSQTELQWEALNTAEHITSVAKIAVLADRQSTVSIKTLEFLTALNHQLLRLRWLTSHVK